MYENDERFPKSHKKVRSVILDQSEMIKKSVVEQLETYKLSGGRISITGDEYSSLRNRKYINLNSCTENLPTF